MEKIIFTFMMICIAIGVGFCIYEAERPIYKAKMSKKTFEKIYGRKPRV